MTMTNEITICANKLANAGKKPTVALIKSKLSQPAPLITIISVLKNWQHQPEFIELPNQIADKKNGDKTVSKDKPLLDTLMSDDSVKKVIEQVVKQAVNEEMVVIKAELFDMKLLIKQLTEQLKQK